MALTGMLSSLLGVLKAHLKLGQMRNDKDINLLIRRFIREIQASTIPPRENTLRPEILIPCFNQGRYLAQAVKSVAGTSTPITVINDASTDDTENHIRDLSRHISLNIITNDKNLLQWGSLNKAISLSDNNLFIVLNADDVLLPFSIDLILQIFKERTDVRMVGGSCISFSNDMTLRLLESLPHKLNYKPIVKLFGPHDAWNFAHLNDINMTMSSCSFLRSAWGSVGGFRKSEDRVCSYDDRDFQMRVSAVFQVAVVEEPLAFYRIISSTNRGTI